MKGVDIGCPLFRIEVRGAVGGLLAVVGRPALKPPPLAVEGRRAGDAFDAQQVNALPVTRLQSAVGFPEIEGAAESLLGEGAEGGAPTALVPRRGLRTVSTPRSKVGASV